MRALINAKAVSGQYSDPRRRTQVWSHWCWRAGLASDFMVSLLVRHRIEWPERFNRIEMEVPQRGAESEDDFEILRLHAFEAAVTAEKVRLRLAFGVTQD